MAFLVDTSVWSLALRRDSDSGIPHVKALNAALLGGDDVATCGIVLLELSQGLVPTRVRDAVSESFRSLTWLEPRRSDYEQAADLSNTCRSRGVQLATVDALIAQLAIEHDMVLLTTDQDFIHAAEHIPLTVWRPHE